MLMFFFADLSMKLHENTNMNKHIIELVEGKQSFYWHIYILIKVELEMFKKYIEIYVKTEFI